MRREFRCLLFAALLSSALTFSHISHMVKGDQTALVRVIPGTIELGPEDVVGQIITVAVVIEDVENLNAIYMKFAWNTTYLQYNSHTMTMPLDSFGSVQPPSPYAGLLYEPCLMITIVPDPPNGTFEVTMGECGPPFTGSGTVFVISFRVIDQPQSGEDVTLDWHFISIELADSQANPISYQVQSGAVIIHAPEPPPSPPVGGTSTSIDSGKFSSWITTTLLLVAVVVTLNVKWNRRGKKH